MSGATGVARAPGGQAIELACLDMAGTTVADGGVVEQAFAAALDELGIGAADPSRAQMTDYVRATMGQSKIVVFRALFGDEARAQAANAAFESAFSSLVRSGAVHAVPGARGAMEALRGAGVKVALTTGFAAPTRDELLAALGWGGVADLVLSPSDAGRGRPWPDMVLTALVRLKIGSVRAVAVAGDTAADIESGVRAGASLVAGVLTGADDRTRLEAAGATVVLESIVELPGVLGVPPVPEGPGASGVGAR